MTETTFAPKLISYYQMDYYELEEITKKVYGADTDYSVQSALECGNDTSHTFNIQTSDIDMFERFDKVKLDDFFAGKAWREPYVEYVLIDLCMKKHLPFGKYVINVSY
jgi:hypothetical protein